ncbi:MAG: alanine dehydrogenase, partial [Chloroflexi bacterium]|nr:alanine dehydrogenase [Chloroflexota bacterium]
MIVGLPKEIKDHEYRVAITPAGVAALAKGGHQILVQKDAGAASGFTDDQYHSSGAQLVNGPEEIFSTADMVVKVKEPVEAEYPLLRPDLTVFTYLHLAGIPQLTTALLDKKVTGIAYETVQLPDGSLPLLTPMSEVAGRLSVQAGAHKLEKHQGGGGKLFAGVPGGPPAKGGGLGGGVVGTHAAPGALGVGAQGTAGTRDLDRLRYLS